MSNELYKKGMETRRAVLGNTYVDGAESSKTELDADFQEYLTSNVWGNVWSRAGLTKRERSLIVIALMAALGHDEELALHIRATQNTGASKEDVKEVLLQTAAYAGLPAANNAFKIAKRVYNEMETGTK
jgi:4-carboxymuconolactone decarboxylase